MHSEYISNAPKCSNSPMFYSCIMNHSPATEIQRYSLRMRTPGTPWSLGCYAQRAVVYHNKNKKGTGRGARFLLQLQKVWRLIFLWKKQVWPTILIYSKNSWKAGECNIWESNVIFKETNIQHNVSKWLFCHEHKKLERFPGLKQKDWESTEVPTFAEQLTTVPLHLLSIIVTGEGKKCRQCFQLLRELLPSPGQLGDSDLCVILDGLWNTQHAHRNASFMCSIFFHHWKI